MANQEIEICIKKTVKEYIDNVDGETPINQMYDLIIGEVESVLIAYALELHQNNQTKAAHWLGITRNTLKKKMSVQCHDSKV